VLGSLAILAVAVVFVTWLAGKIYRVGILSTGTRPSLGELVRWIRGQGMTPILAHPERHNFFWEDLSRVDGLVDAGAWLQVTVDSLIGNHGPAPSQAGRDLLRRHREIVLASDAHNLKRCSGMAAGYQWVREHEGDDCADDLLCRGEHVRARVERTATAEK